MLRVGLTGNIACGKSFVAKVFSELGAQTIDADLVAHLVMEPGRPAYRNLVLAFGSEILGPDGFINRRRLAQIVFSDECRRLELNAIVHPAVREEVERRIVALESGEGRGIVVVDAALMIESGSYRLYRRIVVVRCDRALQVSRLKARNGLSEEEARARILSQMPTDEKARYADFVIDNSGSFSDTRRQVEFVYARLLEEESDSR